jgi:Zn-finger protein
MSETGNKELRDHLLADGHEVTKCRQCLLSLKEKGLKTLTTIRSLKNPSRDIHEDIDELLAKL